MIVRPKMKVHQRDHLKSESLRHRHVSCPGSLTVYTNLLSDDVLWSGRSDSQNIFHVTYTQSRLVPYLTLFLSLSYSFYILATFCCWSESLDDQGPMFSSLGVDVQYGAPKSVRHRTDTLDAIVPTWARQPKPGYSSKRARVSPYLHQSHSHNIFKNISKLKDRGKFSLNPQYPL